MADRDKQTRALATELIHADAMRSPFGETSEAMFLTQSFVYDSADAARARFAGEDDGYVYSRYANPSVSAFEARMARLEGAEAARATASGMAAVSSALLCDLRAGDHVVAARALFGSCRWVIEDLLPRYGIASTLVDGEDLDAWRGAVGEKTRLLFLETPANPTLALVDIEGVAATAREAGARLIVDNVFATPLFQRPLELGAHVVVYSTTKHVDGQGRCLGGVVLSDEAWIEETYAPFHKHTGPAMSPFNAWVMSKGLETLELRVRRQAETAAAVADALAGHPALASLSYPGRADHPQAELARRQMTGGGTLVAFDVKGGRDAAFRFADALEIVAISNNLGDARSLVTHPATTTHQRLAEEERASLGIGDGLMRLSVGLEDAGDLVADLTQALDAAEKRVRAVG